jgi:hypothetical protein
MMGLGRLWKIARLSENNCRPNIRNLIAKLALEEISPENSRAGIGKTYRVYSYAAILERRRAAGLVWVIRTKGVVSWARRKGTKYQCPLLIRYPTLIQYWALNQYPLPDQERRPLLNQEGVPFRFLEQRL